MTHFIVTANRLLDGSVAYLTPDRRWSSDIDTAARWTSAGSSEPELGWARRQEQVICDPYCVEVALVEGRARPKSVRERIRAEGPLPTLRRLGYLASEPARRAVG